MTGRVIEEKDEKAENKFIRGVPPAVLLPAKNWLFKVTKDYFVIDIPRKGAYEDLAPDLFDRQSGEFEIFSEENSVLYMPAITKVLFAVSKYPDLESNQFFAPISIKISEDTVSIAGMIISMMLPVDKDGKPLISTSQPPLPSQTH